MSHGHLSYNVLAPRSRLYQGPFGRICSDLPPAKVLDAHGQEIKDEATLDAHLRDIADNRMSERPGEEPGDLLDEVPELEAEFSSEIPAGYTYFGQFIDHDITFDPVSMLMRRNDPEALVNFRTPRLDLDCIYGRGPDDQPYLYTADKKHMLIGKVPGTQLRDLPRNVPEGGEARALIGDMRNDENAIVSQLQLAFLLAHNTLVDRACALGAAEAEQFEMARQSLRWLYQWIVWHDFLKRIVLADTWNCAMKLEEGCGRRRVWNCGLTDVYSWKHQPFMPVEFSVAAYRFGHSMVRNAYQTNQPHRGFGNFAPIFAQVAGDVDEDDLRGFRPMQPKNIIQWDWFLQMTTSRGPFPQLARKIDTKLANALLRLHEVPGEPAHRENVLAWRNLKRSWTFDLPSGSDMARKFCIDPIPLEPDEPRLLWYYILREAELASAAEGRTTLGALGSLILCAVFSGLLRGDPRGWVNMAPCWTPDDDPLLCPGVDNVDSAGDGTWTLAAIIRLAGLPVNDQDVSNQTDGTFPDTVSCVAVGADPGGGGASAGGSAGEEAGGSSGGESLGGGSSGRGGSSSQSPTTARGSKGRHKDELWRKPGRNR